MLYKIRIVKTKKEKKLFHKIQRYFYKGDANFCPPLELLIENIFTPSKNSFFSHGQAERFLLYNNKDEVVGRVAAFINEKKAYTFEYPTGGLGFFECVNDKKAAFCLFDAAKQWLSERGMQAMDGPISFGENDNYWGLLVEGFTETSMGMQYNPHYYKDFFEAYGFRNYFEQISHMMDLRKPFPERFVKVAKWVSSKPHVRCEHLDLQKKDKYISDLKEIHDEAWQCHENFTPLSRKTIEKEFTEGKSVIDPDLIGFAYYNNEAAAFLVMIPNAGQIFKKFNGRLNLFNKIRFLIMKKLHYIKHTRITILGVKPKFQNKGMESALFYYLRRILEKKHYTHVEISWVGDFNQKMVRLLEDIGADFHQKHCTYRYLFDSTKEFKRAEIIK